MAKTSKVYPKLVKDLPRVNGKVFCITGTTSGTGFVAAQTVAQLGGEAVLLNRKSERVTNSLAKLKESVPDGKFVSVECDLQDFSSVRRAIAEIKSKYDKIYCLSNNAGMAAAPDKATVDGYDVQMQTNHLSHFLIAAELYPLLQKQAQETGDARIVSHSSLARNMTANSKLERQYLEKNSGNLGGDGIGFLSGAQFERYNQSKLANSVFTYGLHNKLEAKNSKVRAICAHPGASETNFGDHLDMGWFGNLLGRTILPLLTQTSEDGATGLIKGMIEPEATSGVLYGPKNGMRGEPVPSPPKPYETDREAIDMLWATSEAATGIKFNV